MGKKSDIKINKIPKRKIFVGLSGGVDSAVSAALLKQAGYDVTGIFIKVWQPDWLECSWKEERLSAMRVAAHLRIPFETLDLSQEYKTGVIDYMLSEYAAGRTPNPDVMCNREVKFGAFWRYAAEQGADFVATGHYAQVTSDQTKAGQTTYHLSKGADSNKDQSYFLWTLNQADLAHIMFPVGHLTKPEVRRLAEKFKLPNATKKDSQGLCFIGHVDLKEFLGHYIETKPGQVLDVSGQNIGMHPGAAFFTIGERHGFEITRKTPHDEPYFVVGKNMKLNTITVANRKTNDLTDNATTQATLRRTNWLSGHAPLSQIVEMRGRYREALFQGTVTTATADTATITFAKAQNTITPGQSLVLYRGEECLGGGIIV